MGSSATGCVYFKARFKVDFSQKLSEWFKFFGNDLFSSKALIFIMFEILKIGSNFHTYEKIGTCQNFGQNKTKFLPFFPSCRFAQIFILHTWTFASMKLVVEAYDCIKHLWNVHKLTFPILHGLCCRYLQTNIYS